MQGADTRKDRPALPAGEREEVWERVQKKYVEFISGWRTDLGGKDNFHNGPGGNYDCVALMAYYVVCRGVTSRPQTLQVKLSLHA